jgi:hypothetical protein
VPAGLDDHVVRVMRGLVSAWPWASVHLCAVSLSSLSAGPGRELGDSDRWPSLQRESKPPHQRESGGWQ